MKNRRGDKVTGPTTLIVALVAANHHQTGKHGETLTIRVSRPGQIDAGGG